MSFSSSIVILKGMSGITQVLGRLDRGEPQAAEELISLVYEELRRMAAQKMAQEQPGLTLQPTALVHEAWLRLGADEQPSWRNRAHFFGAAAEAMRRILVERARRRSRIKRGAGQEHVPIDNLEIGFPEVHDDRVLQVNAALEKLALTDPSKASLVSMRYFAGLTFEEAAQSLGIAVPTAKEWWAYARAWLSVELQSDQTSPPHPASGSRRRM